MPSLGLGYSNSNNFLNFRSMSDTLIHKWRSVNRSEMETVCPVTLWRFGGHLDDPMMLLFTIITSKQDTKMYRKLMLFSWTQNFQWRREMTYLGDLDRFWIAVHGHHVETSESRHVLSQSKPLWWLHQVGEKDSCCDLDFSPFTWDTHGNSAALGRSPRASFLKSFSNMYRRDFCSLLRKLFLEEQSSHFWKIMVATDPKSWPWTPANVFLTPKCPAKTK